MIPEILVVGHMVKPVLFPCKEVCKEAPKVSSVVITLDFEVKIFILKCRHIPQHL